MTSDSDSTQNPPRRPGRPTKYDPSLLPQIEKICATYGSTIEQLAEFLGVNVDSIYEWQNKYPEFSEAIRNGKQIANARVERALYERAIGYSHKSEKLFYDKETGEVIRAETTEQYAPDTRACESWLFNRDPERWKNRQQIEHSGKITVVPALRIKSK